MYICVLSVIKVRNEMGTCWNYTILKKNKKNENYVSTVVIDFVSPFYLISINKTT